MVNRFSKVLARVGPTKSVLPRLAKIQLGIEIAEFLCVIGQAMLLVL